MYRLLRRISSSITTRIDKTWNGSITDSTSAPQVGSKRRRDSEEDDLEGVDETGRLIGSVAKRSKLVSEVSEEQLPLPPPSPTPSPRENTPEPSATKEVVEQPSTDNTAEEEGASTSTTEPTDAKELNSETITAEEHVQQEDDEKPEAELTSAESTSPAANDDAPSSSSEEIAPTSPVGDSDPITPIEQSPVLEDTTTSSNIEAVEFVTIEAKGTVTSEVSPAALTLPTPTPIEVN